MGYFSLDFRKAKGASDSRMSDHIERRVIAPNVDRIAQKVVEGKLRDRSHVLISIDQDGNYECTVEEPLELDAMPLDDLLTEGDK